MIALVAFLTTIAAVIVVFAGVRRTLGVPRGVLLAWTVPVVAGYVALLVLQPQGLVLSNALLLVTSVLVGSLLGTTLGSEAALVTFAVTAAVVDLFSFSGGLTRSIVTSYRNGESLLLQYLSITVPVGSRIVPVIGIGDLVIVSCIFYCLKRLDHPDRDSLLVALGGLSIALGIGLVVGGMAAVPFLAGAVTVYLVYRNRRERSVA